MSTAASYVLQHAEPTTCPHQFRLESYQHTREACIKTWEEFNKNYNESK
jgi:hypothetical protein